MVRERFLADGGDVDIDTGFTRCLKLSHISIYHLLRVELISVLMKMNEHRKSGIYLHQGKK